MKLFSCPSCRQVLFLDSHVCIRCGSQVAFDPSKLEMIVASSSAGDGTAAPICANAEYGVCNWLTDQRHPLCIACRHNGIIPTLTNENNRQLWGRLERAKHYLWYGLRRFGLTPSANLVFNFLGEDSEKVMTGHEDGRITIALVEADDVERERRRTKLGEPYRTLLGHFRHEVGHFFWDEWVGSDVDAKAEFRRIFGDESEDYQEALNRYYEHGPKEAWPEGYVSAYASMHPWEDFAETWAHYLHIVDTIETATAFSIGLAVPNDTMSHWPFGEDPYRGPQRYGPDVRLGPALVGPQLHEQVDGAW